MLIKLRLKNIALIEIIEINFEKGLNILTGDSGSGKSLILDSLNVLFGGTNIPLNHLIRPGKQDCLIEAKFSSSIEIDDWLRKNGFKKSYSELNVKRRSYKKNNKILSKFTLNDLSINKKILEDLGCLLIDFAGQSDSFLFDSQDYRRNIIDDLGSKEFKEVNRIIKNTWKKFESLNDSLKKKVEYLKQQEENNLLVKEMYKILEEANLNSKEEIFELEAQENKLANNFEINNLIQITLKNLNNSNYEDQSVGFLVSQSIRHLNKISEHDAKIQDFRDKLLGIQNDIESLILDLKLYIQEFESCDISLDDVQKRLFFLKNLERTFFMDLPELIEKRDKLKKQFFNNTQDNEMKTLELEIKTLEIKLNSLFEKQSLERKKIANELNNSVKKILNSLGLENANFSVLFDDVKPSENGIDNIKFLFSANPDQMLAPLSKIISGGEMSRFLLAIKSSISKKPNTFFLDEIDSGLSGKSLYSLVALIKEISNNQQVLCITHQPYLAAAAKAHYKVKKNVIDGLTYTSISKLTTKKERQNELVELIGGEFGEVNDYASGLLDKAA